MVYSWVRLGEISLLVLLFSFVLLVVRLKINMNNSSLMLMGVTIWGILLDPSYYTL